MYTEIFVSWILQLFAFWFFNFNFFLENFFLPTTFTHTHTHEPHPRPKTSTHYPRPTTFSYTLLEPLTRAQNSTWRRSKVQKLMISKFAYGILMYSQNVWIFHGRFSNSIKSPFLLSFQKPQASPSFPGIFYKLMSDLQVSSSSKESTFPLLIWTATKSPGLILN